MTQTESINEKILKRIPWEIAILALILALPTLILFDAVSALLVFTGSLLAAAEFIWLKKSITKILLDRKKQAFITIMLLYGLRFLLIIAVFFIIILFFSKKLHLQPVFRP
jgi:uncharacterized membrane protein